MWQKAWESMAITKRNNIWPEVVKIRKAKVTRSKIANTCSSEFFAEFSPGLESAIKLPTEGFLNLVGILWIIMLFITSNNTNGKANWTTNDNQ